MDGSNLSQITLRTRKCKNPPSYPIVKSKKINIPRSRAKRRKSEIKKIERLINNYIVLQQIYQDVPSFTDVRSLYKKLKDLANEENNSEELKRKLFQDIGFTGDLGLLEDDLEKEDAEPVASSISSANRSTVSDCDTTMANGSGCQEDTIISQESSYCNNSNRETSILNKSDHELSEVFSKLSLHKYSKERSKRCSRKLKPKKPTANSTMHSTVRNSVHPFDDISMIKPEPLDKSGDEISRFIELDDTVIENTGEKIKMDNFEQSMEESVLMQSVIESNKKAELKNSSEELYHMKDSVVKTKAGRNIKKKPKRVGRKVKAKRESVSFLDSSDDKENTLLHGTQHRRKTRSSSGNSSSSPSPLMSSMRLTRHTSKLVELMKDISMINPEPLDDSGDKTSRYIELDDTVIEDNGNKTALNKCESNEEDEMYYSQTEDSVIEAHKKSVRFLDETLEKEKTDNKAEKNNNSVGTVKSVGIHRDLKKAEEGQGDAVAQFNRLRNVTVRRGRKFVAEDADTTLQPNKVSLASGRFTMEDVDTTLHRTKVSLAPGKMWKRSLINNSIREQHKVSHKFCRSFVSYSEEFSSAVSFKSRRSSSLSSTGDEDTLYETVLSSSLQYDDNEFCRKKILDICQQEDVVSFEDRYPSSALKNCKKIGEGVYGEVFKLNNSVIKIMPIEGDQSVNGEEQKKFREIFSEIMVTKETSDLQYRTENSTPCFTELLKCSCVRGRYPDRLVTLWEEFAKTKKSYNDHPRMFEEDQIFIILELKNGGNDSGDIKYRSPNQTYAMILQVVFSLAVAEVELEFEHRDLHMSNILVLQTDQDESSFTLDDTHYAMKTAGVQVTIIDFTISRCFVGEKICYYDLSQDEELFEGEGDYQFDMYRMMRKQCQNNWQNFTPKNNVFWIHYLVDKATCLKKGYQYLRAPRHQAFELLEELGQNALHFDSCYEMVHAMCSPHSTEFPLLKKSKLIRSARRK
ncbi:hypothetical protein M8J76_005597 [Diaphorina citri]|nr:hypothetical protein M8J76_005597 [Diaphorina citri]